MAGLILSVSLESQSPGDAARSEPVLFVEGVSTVVRCVCVDVCFGAVMSAGPTDEGIDQRCPDTSPLSGRIDVAELSSITLTCLAVGRGLNQVARGSRL